VDFEEWVAAKSCLFCAFITGYNDLEVIIHRNNHELLLFLASGKHYYTDITQIQM
jgi:hypothetical protein